MKLLRSTIVVFAVLLLATASIAQGGGGGRGQGRGGGMGQRGGMMGGIGQLLQRNDVATELKLSDDQKTKIREANDKINAERRDMFQNMSGGGDRESMMAEMQKRQAGWDKMLTDILNADQQKRAKELQVQRGGNAIAFMEPFAKELGVTDDQKSKYRDLQMKQMEAMRDMNQDMSREERQAMMEKNRKIMNDEIEKILTQAQRDKLKTMGGAPFKFEEGRGGGG